MGAEYHHPLVLSTLNISNLMLSEHIWKPWCNSLFKNIFFKIKESEKMSLFLNMEQMEHVSNVRKICENTDFH